MSFSVKLKDATSKEGTVNLMQRNSREQLLVDLL